MNGKKQFKNLTQFKDINDLLSDWTQGVKKIAGKNLVGLYLSGSLAYGNFVLKRSDIDLQAVLRRPLNQKELDLLERLHEDLNERHLAWKDRVECSYTSLELLSKILPPKTPRPWWGFDKFYPAAPAGNEWIINHYFLSKYGIALYGPEFITLIPRIDLKEVKKASAQDLFKEWEPKINDPEWLENSHYQSYLVLNLCRILHTVIGDGPGSKKNATEWTGKTYPQWKDLIQEAQDWEYGKQMERSDEAISFIKFSVDQVNKTGILD